MVYITKPHGKIQSLIGLKWQRNNRKKPLLSRHNRQGTVQSIAYPSRRKCRSNCPQIPAHPPPSLADEITRAEPMSTFNALANQPKKGTILLYEKYWDSCIVEVIRETT